MAIPQRSWSRDAVIYEVYVRSFADSDGDGVGDLPGITSRLDHLAALGVDALWLTPFYSSPMADGGYDVADHRSVDPTLGTLDDMTALIAAAHERGLKIIIDIVPNHVSDQHLWFRAAVAAAPGSIARDRFIFRPGRGVDGSQPPNNWQSTFHGPAWTRLPDGDWYLHLFATQQPDLNWQHPQVRDEFVNILRFWLDRGVDGIRIDVAHALVKAQGLPDVGDANPSPMWDLDGVHLIYQQWRAILESYRPERIAVAEAWVSSPERSARYVRPGYLHQAFNFNFLTTAWDALAYRQVIDESLAAMSAVRAPTTWVLSNHDVIRHRTRLAPGADPQQSLRRARAATLLMLALPGSAYLYQGEELGLPEVLDLPPEARQDPVFLRSHGADRGRDGCRVPLPWSGSQAPFGFGPSGSTRAWLPQPASWADLTAEHQRTDPDSTLSMYATALRLRKALPVANAIIWHSDPDASVLAFERPGLRCVVNLGTTDAKVDVPGETILASGSHVAPALIDGLLPPDSAIWVATA
jgi:alpha-glucosidase